MCKASTSRLCRLHPRRFTFILWSFGFWNKNGETVGQCLLHLVQTNPHCLTGAGVCVISPFVFSSYLTRMYLLSSLQIILFPSELRTLICNQGKFSLYSSKYALLNALHSLCLIRFMLFSAVTHQMRCFHSAFHLKNRFFFLNLLSAYSQSSDFRTYILHNAQADTRMAILRGNVKVLFLFVFGETRPCRLGDVFPRLGRAGGGLSCV